MSDYIPYKPLDKTLVNREYLDNMIARLRSGGYGLSKKYGEFLFRLIKIYVFDEIEYMKGRSTFIKIDISNIKEPILKNKQFLNNSINRSSSMGLNILNIKEILSKKSNLPDNDRLLLYDELSNIYDYDGQFRFLRNKILDYRIHYGV